MGNVMTEEEIINDVQRIILNEWTAEERNEFYFSPYKGEDLIQYHYSLGRWIRNNYKLWERSWEPCIIDEVDYSPNHPDAVSMKIIREVWKRGLNTQCSNGSERFSLKVELKKQLKNILSQMFN